LSSINTFSGKQNTHNKEILTTLLKKGPLTTSQITKLLAAKNPHNLQSTLKNRLNALERKNFIRQEKRKWLLCGKGIIAVLLVEPETDAWSPKWSDIFYKSLVLINESTTFLGLKQEDTDKTVHDVGLCLNELNAWKGLAKITLGLIDRGVVEFDEISDSTLFSLLIMETLSLEDVAGLFAPEKKIKCYQTATDNNQHTSYFTNSALGHQPPKRTKR
jgi:hypothetical protein